MNVAPGWLQGVTRSLASATMARNSLLGLKTGTGRAATSTGSPVRGLRAMRVFRWRIFNVPNPRISMLCCSASAAFTASRKESTTRAQSFLEIRGPAVRAICAVTFSTRSAFVIRPPCRAQGQSRRGANIRAYLLCVKSLEELLEVPLGIVGTGRSLRVVLHRENRVLPVLHPFDGAIVEVKVGDLKRFGTRHAAGVAPQRETMVLRRDKYLSCREIPHGLVAAPMAVWELHRVAPERQPEQLVTEADPENRQRAVGQLP